MDFAKLNGMISPPDEDAMLRARARWDSIAKPLGSLGLLEEDVVRIAGLTGSEKVRLDKRAVLVLCADNGVVAEGVTQAGQEVTALVAGNMASGDTSVCRMAAVAGAEVFPVDVGMARRVPGVDDRHIADGTENLSRGPAMSREQALRALELGMELVREKRDAGYRILATGEMGIGNTTSSSAVCACLLGEDVRSFTGRGAGLSDAGLERKVEAISRGIRVNRPEPSDPLDVLHKLGGFDIAAMAGVFLGGALYRVPVLADGFISAVAALVAVRLCPTAKCAVLASHVSAEPAAHRVLEELGLPALIHAGMRLGEGTGAVCALPLLDMALAVYNGMSTFEDIELDPYTPLGGEGR